MFKEGREAVRQGEEKTSQVRRSRKLCSSYGNQLPKYMDSPHLLRGERGWQACESRLARAKASFGDEEERHIRLA